MSDSTEINIYALDIEWKTHSTKYLQAMHEAGYLADALNRKNAYYKYMKGQTYIAYSVGKKEILSSDGTPVKKPTGPLITASVDSDEDLYVLQKEINDIERDYSVAKNYAEAIRQNKYALQDEVRLFLSGYFSEPSSKGIEGGEDYQQKIEEVQKKIEASSEVTERKRRREIRKKSNV